MPLVIKSISTDQTTGSSGGTTTGVTLTPPAGIQNGDLLLLAVEFEDGSSAEGLAGPTISTPAGFTKLGGTNNFAPHHSWAVFSKTASNESGNYVVVSSNQDISDRSGIMLRISGWDPGVSLVFSNSDSSFTSPSVNTTAALSAVFRGKGVGQATAPPVPDGQTNVQALNVTFAASQRIVRSADQAAGATGTVTWADQPGAEHAWTLAIGILAGGEGDPGSIPGSIGFGLGRLVGPDFRTFRGY
jgi:hypothetical protein